MEKTFVQLVAEYANIVGRHGPDANSARQFRDKYEDNAKFLKYADAIDRIKRNLSPHQPEPEPADEPTDELTVFHQAAKIGDFTIVGMTHEYHLSFAAYQAAGRNGTGPDADLIYRRPDSDGINYDFVSTVGDAQSFMHGYIKWDGCCNVIFDEQSDDMMLHFCDRDGAAKVGELFDTLYDLAKKLIPRWDGNRS